MLRRDGWRAARFRDHPDAPLTGAPGIRRI